MLQFTLYNLSAVEDAASRQLPLPMKLTKCNLEAAQILLESYKEEFKTPSESYQEVPGIWGETAHTCATNM